MIPPPKGEPATLVSAGEIRRGNSMTRRVILIGLIALLTTLAACSGDGDHPVAPAPDSAIQKSASGDYGVNILPPDAVAHGLTYSEWSQKWWQWLWSIPVSQNPGLDATGEFVSVGQEGPVWFLAPAYYGVWERTATIPTGKMLFIDLAGFCASLSMGDGADEAEVREVAGWFIDNAVSNVILEVDGARLENVEDFRFATPPGLFDVTLPEDNMWAFFGYSHTGGTYENDAVSDGYYALLPPLSAGQHTIFLSADFGDPYNDRIQVTYHLTVEGGRRIRHRHH